MLAGIVRYPARSEHDDESWLSSSPNHQWNPSQKAPETDWEAEIDKLMLSQASSALQAERKAAVDRVQQIVADQQPFIFLVCPNVLQAISPHLRGVEPAIVAPGPLWNIELIRREEINSKGNGQ